MNGSSPDRYIQSLISFAIPDAIVTYVQGVHSLHCQATFNVYLADGSCVLLTCAPPLMAKLLRSEKGCISSEAIVLEWLNSPSHNDRPQRTSDTTEGHMAGLPRLMPRLIGHSAPNEGVGGECNILEPTPGVISSSLDPRVTPAEKQQLDFNIGRFHRQLCLLQSPSKKFGPAFAVLSSSFRASFELPKQSIATRNDANARMSESGGVSSWSTAFHSLLEAILRDGEDMAVTLSYAAIRRHLRRFQPYLDRVTRARFVAVDVGDELNTLVARIPRSSRRSDKYDGRRDQFVPTAKCHTDLVLTGMQDWSNCVFGDPLFAKVFSQEPSDAFHGGFADCSSGFHRPAAGTQNLPNGMVEDKEHASVRLLLYKCYHATTDIVREFYRPQRGSNHRELAARRDLNSALAALDILGSATGRDPAPVRYGRHDSRT